MDGADSIALPELVRQELLSNLRPMLCQIGQMQNNVQSLLIDGHIEDIGAIVKLNLGQILQRDAHLVEHRCIVIIDCK